MEQTHIPERLVELKDEQSQKIVRIFSEIGVDLETISPAIVERLRMLNEKTNFLEDEHTATHMAKAVFSWYEENDLEHAWNDIEKRIVLVGTMFTDIGKTGPKSANHDQQTLISEMYNVEEKVDPEMRVSAFLSEKFENGDERNELFKSMGLDPEMSMRSFWNLHAEWTLEIIKGDGVPPEAVAAAATHHFIQGINPGQIVGEDGKYVEKFGENDGFDRPEKLIILLDKYDAYIRRSKQSHEGAIAGLNAELARSAMFASDEQFLRLIEVLDHVNRTE